MNKLQIPHAYARTGIASMVAAVEISTLFGNALCWGFHNLDGLVRSVAVSPKDRQLPPQVATAADDVLEAEDRDDLEDRLEGMLLDGVLTPTSTPEEKQNCGFSELIASTRKIPSTPLDSRSLQRVLGCTAAQKCENAWNSFWPPVVALLDLLEEGMRISRSQVETPTQDDSSGEELPLSIRKALYSLKLSFAAATVIARAEGRKDSLPPWLSLALAEVFSDGLLKVGSALKPLTGSRLEQMTHIKNFLEANEREQARKEKLHNFFVEASNRLLESGARYIYPFHPDTHAD